MADMASPSIAPILAGMAAGVCLVAAAVLYDNRRDWTFTPGKGCFLICCALVVIFIFLGVYFND